jgi:hypothetical protein
MLLSKSNLTKYASKDKLNREKRDSVVPPAPANAIVFENTYRMKPEMKLDAINVDLDLEQSTGSLMMHCRSI